MCEEKEMSVYWTWEIIICFVHEKHPNKAIISIEVENRLFDITDWCTMTVFDKYFCFIDKTVPNVFLQENRQQTPPSNEHTVQRSFLQLLLVREGVNKT